MDLTLGLSLGGCFTNDPKETRLVRSSSTAALTMAPKEKEILPSAAPIARTCSLPLDEEDENRKRKEMQSLKRMEAKMKRSVKRNSLREMMPCVSTKVEGPDGKRVEGFLYKYRKGEEVRILCVCHGSFLSPAEFIKHAGGGDVDNPLRHILVKPKLIN
ncbi:Ninja-family protein AFP3 [Apostasia shenzhenica]|uniref:Ninja-family protein n=1 Tax=Apostasia shenzhenica TaxID=1088818 RepID=A0A2I0BAX0_9ASPA|nr:Ninja-family protein AFP3 [Apostasia shenzhenica]